MKDLDTSKRNYEQILTDKILSLELKIDQLRAWVVFKLCRDNFPDFKCLKIILIRFSNTRYPPIKFNFSKFIYCLALKKIKKIWKLKWRSLVMWRSQTFKWCLRRFQALSRSWKKLLHKEGDISVLNERPFIKEQLINVLGQNEKIRIGGQ